MPSRLQQVVSSFASIINTGLLSEAGPEGVWDPTTLTFQIHNCYRFGMQGLEQLCLVMMYSFSARHPLSKLLTTNSAQDGCCRHQGWSVLVCSHVPVHLGPLHLWILLFFSVVFACMGRSASRCTCGVVWAWKFQVVPQWTSSRQEDWCNTMIDR